MRNFCIVTDSFPPIKNSASSLMYVLSCELSKRYLVDVYTMNSHKNVMDNARIISFNCGDIKRRSYFLRAALELLSSFYFIFYYIIFVRTKYTDVVFYNPSIFQVFFVQLIKIFYRDCNIKLILRDIFPDWAIDLGLIKAKIAIKILKYFQYQNLRVSDVIFCESVNKLKYMKKKFPRFEFDILYNWVKPLDKCERKRKNNEWIRFIYAGNVGPAQNLECYLSFLKELSCRGIKIDFYAFGEDLEKIKSELILFKNIKFLDVISFDDLNSELLKSNGGLVFLDPNLDLDNIPGKILSYLSAGLPVFGFVNKGNELVNIINNNKMGFIGDDVEAMSPNQFCERVFLSLREVKPCNIVEKTEMFFSLKSAIEKIIAKK